MPIWRIDSSRSSPRALEFAPVCSGITFDVPVEHGHRTEAESFDSFKPFSGKVERIAWITNEDVTAKNIPVAIARFPEEFSGVFERRKVIRSVISEENLFRLDFPE